MEQNQSKGLSLTILIGILVTIFFVFVLIGKIVLYPLFSFAELMRANGLTGIKGYIVAAPLFALALLGWQVFFRRLAAGIFAGYEKRFLVVMAAVVAVYLLLSQDALIGGLFITVFFYLGLWPLVAYFRAASRGEELYGDEPQEDVVTSPTLPNMPLISYVREIEDSSTGRKFRAPPPGYY